MSAMVRASGGIAPLADFHDTVLPSADTDTAPSCFLYWAAVVDMVVEERGYGWPTRREPQVGDR
jgi:hypothetical protein